MMIDYGLCVGSPEKMTDWTDLIDHYVGTMVDRYGLEEVESWVWCEQIQNRCTSFSQLPSVPETFWLR